MRDLIQATESGVRFERGGGIGGPLAVITIVGTAVVIGARLHSLIGTPGIAVAAAIGIVASAAALRAIAALPVRYLELDASRRVLRLGQNTKGVRTPEVELPIGTISSLAAFDRGGGGASWTVVGLVTDRAALPRQLAERVTPDGRLDLLVWTQEWRSTVQSLLEELARHGCPVDRS